MINSSTQINRNRIVYFDILRGVAILLVIGIHTYNGDADLMNVFFRSLLNCAVPVFFAIAGFFAINNKTGLSQKIARVYIPTLLWSLPYMVFALFVGGGDCFRQIVLFFICGNSVYYFIAVIIQFYIITFIFRKKLATEWSGVILSALCSTIGILCVSYFLFVCQMNIPLIIYAGSCLLWIVFFHLGCFMKIEKHRVNKLYMWIVIAILGLVMSVVESYLWQTYFGYLRVGIKLSAFVYSFAIIMVLFNQRVIDYFANRNNYLIKVVAFIGRLSFGIYLTHCFFIIISDKLQFNWALSFFFAAIVSVCFVFISMKVLPAKYSKYIIGI